MTLASKKEAARAGWVRATLLFIWFLATFGVAFFARDLNQVVADWPLNFWMMAQGSVVVFIAVVMVFAWYMNRQDARAARGQGGQPASPAEEVHAAD